jgi:hypothetical protein
MQRLSGYLLFTALLLAHRATIGLAADPSDEKRTTEIGRTTEKEVSVVLSSSFGTVLISRGEPGKILVSESMIENDKAKMNIDYAIRSRVGYLDISLGDVQKDPDRKKGHFHWKDFDQGKWYLRFSDAVPISFDVELGVGKGDFNLTGLHVKDFNLTTGASDVTLAFDEPNTGLIEHLNLESGVSKFDARNLANANFRRLSFKGGVGTYTLDFGGKLKSEVDVDVEVGLGLLTILIPQEVGAKVLYEKSWVSRLDCDRDFQQSGEDTYLSENYHSAAGKMNIHIDSGFGSIKVRRR